MFLPEYTITTGILQNIAVTEYGKAIIENTTILPNWERQLKREAKIDFIKNSLKMEKIALEERKIKEAVDKISKAKESPAKHLVETLALLEKAASQQTIEEDTIKKLATSTLQKQVKYRSTKLHDKTSPEEILAQLVELIDWYNSMDAMETHPVLRAGILKAQIETIWPFEEKNVLISNLLNKLSLKMSGYGISDYVCLENFFVRSAADYNVAITSIALNDNDLTEWLEYYTDATASETAGVKEKVLLLAKDTKVAKASGKIQLSPRQERIVVYLQDYGMLQNKDFGRLFPDISEDTVLRELKKLMDRGVVVKRGKTKSSRYELN